MTNIITVDFQRDTLFAVREDDGLFVAIKPICQSLGLAWNRQLERIKRDPILSEGMTMTVIPSVGGPQETTLLRLDLINGWLFTIDDSRVANEEIRQKVLAYKRDCYRVLFEHFYSGAPKDMPPSLLPRQPDEQDSEAFRLRKVIETRLTWGVAAAQAMWLKVGLPTVPAMFDGRQPDLFTQARREEV